jgi:hypothetical protein
MFSLIKNGTSDPFMTVIVKPADRHQSVLNLFPIATPD